MLEETLNVVVRLIILMSFVSWGVLYLGHFYRLGVVLSQPSPKCLVWSHVSTPVSWPMSLSQKKMY